MEAEYIFRRKHDVRTIVAAPRHLRNLKQRLHIPQQRFQFDRQHLPFPNQ